MSRRFQPIQSWKAATWDTRRVAVACLRSGMLMRCGLVWRRSRRRRYSCNSYLRPPICLPVTASCSMIAVETHGRSHIRNRESSDWRRSFWSLTLRGIPIPVLPS